MRFQILGPLRVEEDDGLTLQVPQPRQRSLLALLLLSANQALSSRFLIRALWEGADDRSHHGTLRTHAWGLRRTLAPADRLRTTSGGYLIYVRSGELDMDEFRLLAASGREAIRAGDYASAENYLHRAVRLWRDPPLADIPPATSVAPQITRLLDERRLAEESLVEAELALGNYRDVIPRLQQHLVTDPLDEHAWENLMLALYRCGRRAQALLAFARAHEILATEHGIDPGPRLRLIHAQVLADDPVLSHSSAAVG